MHRTGLLSLVAVLAGSAAAVVAAQEGTYRAPRTEAGQPDLQGVWNFSSGVPLQRPAAFADKKFFTKEEQDKRRETLRNALGAIGRFAPVEAIGLEWLDDSLHVTDLRTSLITYPEDGRLPATFDGVRRLPNFEDLLGLLGGAKEGPPPALASVIAMFTGGKKNSYTDFQPSERCLFGPDVPMVPQLDGNYIQIVQAADHVAIVSDFHRRIVALGKRPPLGDQLRSWSGTSTGRWDGETLIVETRNFNDRTPSFAGAGNSHDKIVTERFTRTVKDGLQYSATVVDPKTFKDRIELSFPMARVDVHIQESACHEGNRSLPNALSAARKEDEAIPPR